jgi:hypothetical protein
MSDRASCKAAFIVEAHGLLDAIEDVVESKGDVEKMRVKLDIAKHNRMLLGELATQFRARVRPHLASAGGDTPLVVGQELLSSICGEGAPRLREPIVAPSVVARVLACARGMDAKVDVLCA